MATAEKNKSSMLRYRGPVLRRGWISLLLLLASLAIYHEVREHEFVGFDDYVYIVHNPNLPDGWTGQGILNAFQAYHSMWIPLTSLSYQIDYELYGLEPAGYLLTNVILHGLGAVVLFLALSRMTGAHWRSAFVAALFVVHPLHVESVAWVSERKDVLAGLFWMLTLYAYAGYAEQPSARWRYAATVLCLALGLLAKPTVVTLPFVLLLLDWWPLGRLWQRGAGDSRAASVHWPVVIEKLPMLALVAVASAVAFLVQRETALADPIVVPLDVRIGNAMLSYFTLALQTLWPLDLAVLYPHPLESIASLRPALAAVALAATTFAILRFGVAYPYLPVGWLWYLGALVPMIGLVQVGMQGRADRYMYLPMTGLAIILAWGSVDLAKRWSFPPRALGAAAGALLLGFSVLSFQQVAVWRDTETLYHHTLAITDDNFIIHRNLGNEFLKQGRLDEATASYREAARIKPHWTLPQLGLADVALAQGRVPEALRSYEQVLARDPEDPGASGRYGLALGLEFKSVCNR